MAQPETKKRRLLVSIAQSPDNAISWNRIIEDTKKTSKTQLVLKDETKSRKQQSQLVSKRKARVVNEKTPLLKSSTTSSTNLLQFRSLLWQIMGIQLVLVLLATVLAYLPFGRAATCVTSNISPVPGSSNTYSICVDGKSQRSYLLFIPKNYDADKTDRSIIFSFHGGGRDAPLQKDLDRLTDSYFNEDAIVVYPQGEGVSFCFLLHLVLFRFSNSYTNNTMNRTHGKVSPKSHPLMSTSPPNYSPYCNPSCASTSRASMLLANLKAAASSAY
jgi:hypothetical protein